MSKSSLTLPAFKQWARECAPAAKAVLMARAFAELERERVNAYILPIFERYAFVDGLSRDEEHAGKPIAKPDHLYLCTDEEQVQRYFAECDAAHRAHGFKGPQGHCPALTAEHLLCQTEHALIELAKPLTGIDNVYGDDRRKYLEILIGACVPHIKGGLHADH